MSLGWYSPGSMVMDYPVCDLDDDDPYACYRPRFLDKVPEVDDIS